LSAGLRPFLVAILVIAAFFVGASVGQRSDDVGDFAGNLVGGDGGAELSNEALEVIQDKYFRDVDTDQLEEASVRGMVADLRERYDDRFSHYFGPDAYARFRESTSGRFTGVGLSVTQVPQGLQVETVFADSPAKAAGIRKRDLITAVNGKSIAGDDSQDSTERIKGPEGTEVTLTVRTPGEKSRDLQVTRAEVDVPAVQSSLKEIDGHKVGYVRLTSFTKEGTHAELRDAVERLDDQGAEATLVDLRNNPGGLLTEAILTSSVFVEDGVIVSTNGRTQPDQVYEAQGDAVEPRPVAVLVNGDSASAAEIFTAALNDAGLADVVGETTFGKGVFQEVIELEGGGALDLTVGEFLTRNGVSLAGKGVPPEIPARDIPKTKPDEGLQRALEALGKKLASDGAQPDA
jgi:carboxyl-terminal processing protease